MFASLYLTVLAFVVTLVTATTSVSGTTTSTISMTQTITITRCNPTVTNCPANRQNTTTSSSTHWPVSNTSTVAWPTSYHNKTTTSKATATGAGTGAASTVVVLPSTTAPAATTASTPSSVNTSGAQGLFIQSGLLMGGLAAAIAILA
ncbi:hypothetical protein SCUCBS95973_005155 [Sporothrix curviconia]|uniref:Uncharacterized protein n=1 Tax=Sporothrix curviconia TaxID=1260050 RepID=A0ABP0BWC3_9PEZI